MPLPWAMPPRVSASGTLKSDDVETPAEVELTTRMPSTQAPGPVIVPTTCSRPAPAGHPAGTEVDTVVIVIGVPA